MTNQTLSGASVSSPPSLSSELNSLYQVLSDDQQRLFIKMFNYLWRCVVPASRFNGSGASLHSLWAVEYIRLSLGLSLSSLSLLLFIHHITRRGAKYIDSSQVYSCTVVMPGYAQGSKINAITRLYKSGYLVRSWSNPDEPYLKKSYRSRPVFIKLSVKGIELINNIEKDLYKLLLNTSLNDLTGVNKKPG